MIQQIDYDLAICLSRVVAKTINTSTHLYKQVRFVFLKDLRHDTYHFKLSQVDLIKQNTHGQIQNIKHKIIRKEMRKTRLPSVMALLL